MEREGQTKTDKGGGVSGFSKENNVTLQVIDSFFIRWQVMKVCP